MFYLGFLYLPNVVVKQMHLYDSCSLLDSELVQEIVFG